MHKKIHIVFTCVFLFFFFDLFAQQHTWTNASIIASGSEEAVTSVNAINGGYIISGYVSGTVAGITNNQLYGGRDGFVAKYSSDSKLEWIFTVGTTSDDTVKTEVDNDGNIYAYGNLKGVVHCGGRNSDISIGSEGDSGAYIIKYNSNGRYQSHFESTGNLKIVDVQVSEDGKVVAVCNFKGIVTLGGDSYGTIGYPTHTVFFTLNKNDLEIVEWSNYFNPTTKEIKVIGAVLSNDRLFMVAYCTGSVFGVNYFEGDPRSYTSTKLPGYVLSSIYLNSGRIDWVNYFDVNNATSSLSGVSYSNDQLFFQLNTRDSLYLTDTDDLEHANINTSNKSYTVKLDVGNQEITGLKELRSSDSLNVVDIKALNGNVYLLASYKKDLRSTDFVLNAHVETEEVAVIKLDNNLNFRYANKAKERGDFIEPVALDVFSDDGYYMTGNFSKRVYLDTLSVEYLPSNSKKIFSAVAKGMASQPLDQGPLIDDHYCFVKNHLVNVRLPVLENDLEHNDENRIINNDPAIGSANFTGNEVVYAFTAESNYETSLEYSVENITDKATAFIKVIDSTILAKDSSVCGRENFSVNLYDLFNYSVDTIEFRWNGEIVNNVPLEVDTIQVEIIKVNSLCEEQKVISLNKNVPYLKPIDTSLVSCSTVLAVDELYTEYGVPFHWSENVFSFNETTAELKFSEKGEHTVYFDKLLPVECYIEELETNIEVVLPEKGTSGSNHEMYPLEEVELYGEASLTGENRWEVISGDAHIINSEKGHSTIVMGEKPSEIQYVSIDNHNCVFALDTFQLSIKDFFIPNAFSPNNDGLNETFLIRGSDHINNKQLKVFNTQGLKVYESDDYQNNWNGISIKGEPLPEDIYYFEYIILGKKHTGYIEIKR